MTSSGKKAGIIQTFEDRFVFPCVLRDYGGIDEAKRREYVLDGGGAHQRRTPTASGATPSGSARAVSGPSPPSSDTITSQDDPRFQAAVEMVQSWTRDASLDAQTQFFESVFAGMPDGSASSVHAHTPPSAIPVDASVDTAVAGEEAETDTAPTQPADSSNAKPTSSYSVSSPPPPSPLAVRLRSLLRSHVRRRSKAVADSGATQHMLPERAYVFFSRWGVLEGL